MVFPMNLSESNSAQVSCTFLSILTDLSNAEGWLVSIFPLISNSSSLFPEPLGAVPRALTAIGIIFTLIFYNSFSTKARSKYLNIFSFSFTRIP